MQRSLMLVSVFAVVCTSTLMLAAPIKKPRPATEIETIMQAGFGGYPPGFKRPAGKVMAGTATKEEEAKFVELCKKLSEQKAPKGDAEEWKKMTEALLTAAKDVAAGGDGKAAAVKRVQAAADCKACHDKFQLTPEEEKKRVEEFMKKNPGKDK